MQAPVPATFRYTAGFSLGVGRDKPATALPAAFSTSLAALNAAVAEQLAAQPAVSVVAAPVIIRQARTVAGDADDSQGLQRAAKRQKQERADEAELVDPAASQSDFIAIASVPSASVALPKSATKQAVQALSTLSAAEIDELGRRPYWMEHCRNIRSPFLRLHQEVVELLELLQPTAEEVATRRAAVAQVTQIVQSIWPSAVVTVFGSFATGLYVPTSDIDVVVTDSRCASIPEGLRALAAALQQQGVAAKEKIQVIASSRVPIIKLVTTEYGGLAFDVSFDMANGPQAAELIRDFVDVWPMMRPLVLILKLFLQQRELNEVYTGGIGSYTLITLVSAFLQLHHSRRPQAVGAAAGHTPASQNGKRSSKVAASSEVLRSPYLEASLGVLLVDFFRLFGRVMDMDRVGLTCADGGRFFGKASKRGPEWQGERVCKLAVEDPKDPGNNTCKSSFSIARVKAACDFAYQQLVAPCTPEESRLARILRLGVILVNRKPPANPALAYRTVADCCAVPRQQG